MDSKGGGASTILTFLFFGKNYLLMYNNSLFSINYFILLYIKMFPMLNNQWFSIVIF
jgi:hypothetical protein